VEGLPRWLRTPSDAGALASEEPLDLLAGRLIRWGLVRAEGCPWGGLLADGTASACGVEGSRDFVYVWQDRFDARILEAARAYGVPARLLKNLFAQESQFWPGSFPNVKEYGLGGLHEQGGDTLLLWNHSFYHQFCPLVLSEKTCKGNYADLGPHEQALLRGALAIQADVGCRDCPGSVDLSKAERSVDLFAQILRANCEQVGQTLDNVTHQRAGQVSEYEDLWRYVLVNYNAGSGCLATALNAAWEGRAPLRWEEVAAELAGLKACEGALEYVEHVAAP
jgi:hypothetical protein